MLSTGVCRSAELAQTMPQALLSTGSSHAGVCCAHPHDNSGREGLQLAPLDR